MFRAYNTRVASVFFFFQAEDGIRDDLVTGVQTCALPISHWNHHWHVFSLAEAHANGGSNERMDMLLGDFKWLFPRDAQRGCRRKVGKAQNYASLRSNFTCLASRSSLLWPTAWFSPRRPRPRQLPD